MIFTGFQPNTTKKDLHRALLFLLLPWNWRKLKHGNANTAVVSWLKDYFKVPYVYTCDSGRSALHIALQALNVGHSDEVLVQAYTCMVVSNAINWTGAKPIYVDILDDFTMDSEDLEKKITPRSKVLIIQHTFGTPAQVGRLIEIAKKYNLKIIEDCAHSFGAARSGQLTGMFGDIGMFSFGTDKVVSCQRGGALITTNPDISNKIEGIWNKLPVMKLGKIIQYLLNYPLFAIGKPLYKYGIGKFFLAVAKKLNITGRIMYESEKKGKQISGFPSKMPNAFAGILIDQLKLLTAFNDHRKKIAEIYTTNIKKSSVIVPNLSNDSIILRFPLLVSEPFRLHTHAKKNNIILGTWYDTVIAPKDCNIEASGYLPGSCPYAERLSAQTVNLPTDIHISENDALQICDIINKYQNL